MAEVGIGLVGYKFMGRAHSNAYRQVAHFFDIDPRPRMVALCGRDRAATAAAAAQLGWEHAETDYRQLVTRPDVDLVDVATPGDSHHAIVMAAIAAGKDVLCEKPLANTLDEAREMTVAAKQAGIINMINFNYRRVPAVQLAKQIIEAGEIGEIRHWRAVYLQDWILDPSFPLVWRLKRETAGSGALGDIAAHITDLAHFLVGPITEVIGMLDTFIRERPVEVTSGGGAGLTATAGQELGPVTVDDSAMFLARFANGATGTFEATRLAAGRRNFNSFEINGSLGTIVFNLERMNELQVFFVNDAAGRQGFRTLSVTEGADPYTAHWWPAGHIIGYEHTFIHVVKDLMDGIKTGVSPAPTFADGFRCQAVLDAVERSAASRTWTQPAAAGV